MYIADTLSRAALPLRESDKTNNDQVFNVSEQTFQQELASINFAEAVNVSEQRLQQIRTHTHQDESLQTLKSVVLSGWPVSKVKFQHLSENIGIFEMNCQFRMAACTKAVG